MYSSGLKTYVRRTKTSIRFKVKLKPMIQGGSYDVPDYFNYMIALPIDLLGKTGIEIIKD